MLERTVIDAHRRLFRLTGKKYIFRLPLGVHIVVLLVVALLLNELIARTALAANVEKSGVLAHVAREPRRVVSKTGGVAHKKALGIFEQSLKGVGILASVFPCINAAVRDRRAGKTVFHKPVHHVDSMTHPLVGNTAGKVFVEAKLAINLRIKGPIGFVQKKF